MTARLSAQGRALIKRLEGCVLTAYPDGQNADHSPRYSIGYGHNGVAKGATITRAEADRLFDVDAVKYETAVAKACPVATAPQFDAMTSLSYNIGTDGFTRSTVARRHAAGDTTGAADAFLMWDKETKNGVLVQSKVLEARREIERDIYLHGYGGRPAESGGGPAPVASAPSSAGKASMLPLLLALAGGVAWMMRKGA
jgi:lysozyme